MTEKKSQLFRTKLTEYEKMKRWIYDRRCKTPCKAEHVERGKLFVHVLSLVLPPCFKKQASVKIREASVKVSVKLNS